MLFNSFDFLIYLPCVFILYWLFSSLKWQNSFLIIASCFFYGWLDWRFLILLSITALSTYWSGHLITTAFYEKEDGLGNKKAKLIALLNIILNIVILGLFKYYNFFIESLCVLLQSCGLKVDHWSIRLIMPIGISFYTFMALSYTIDLYKRKIIAPSFGVFVAYLSFFPQLLSGPIGRSTSLIPQFSKIRVFDYGSATDGLRQFLWGLFKKAVIADNCAAIVNSIWGNYQQENQFVLLIAVVLYSFQIYCDFSGYSDMAIGIARLFGINLMKNFNYPYFSRSVAEFWRRWHISLTSWFRDYVYIPLGGSREGKWVSFRNTMIIFILCGLWHGANWTYILWGAFNGLLFLPLLLTGSNKKYKDTVSADRVYPTYRELGMMLITFALVSVGWIIFRADNIENMTSFLVSIITNQVLFIKPKGLLSLCFFITILIIVEWSQRNKNHALAFLDKRFNIGVRWTVYLLLIYWIFKYSVADGNFIYFQF